MSTYTMQLGFLAAIPVGHRVEIDFYEQDVGVTGDNYVLDRAGPVLTDLETGICWAPRKHFQSDKPFAEQHTGDRRHHRTYYGRVLTCTVATRGGDNSITSTQLMIDPMEPPGAQGPYRSGGR